MEEILLVIAEDDDDWGEPLGLKWVCLCFSSRWLDLVNFHYHIYSSSYLSSVPKHFRKNRTEKKKKIQENNRPYWEKVLFDRKGEGETKLPSGWRPPFKVKNWGLHFVCASDDGLVRLGVHLKIPCIWEKKKKTTFICSNLSLHSVTKVFHQTEKYWTPFYPSCVNGL